MIIGLIGFIGSGKGTVASRLVNYHGFRQDSFASSLKDACANLFDWPRELLEGDTTVSREWREKTDYWWADKLQIANFSPRYALQLMGTNVLRNHFNEDIWFLTVENRIRKNPNQHVVISDVRFPNEINFIQKNKGILIKINRGENPEWHDIALKANLGDKDSKEIMSLKFKDIHYSEWAWIGSKIDFQLYNNSTIENLNNQVDEIIKNI